MCSRRVAECRCTPTRTTRSSWTAARSNPRETGKKTAPGRVPARAKEGRLQRAQEVEYVLLVAFAQVVEPGDHAVRFRAGARMLANGALQVRGAPVVQEEDPLSQAP